MRSIEDLRDELAEQRIPRALALVPARPLLVIGATIRIALGPGDRVLVRPGEAVLPGTPLAERTPDAAVVDAGRSEDLRADGGIGDTDGRDGTGLDAANPRIERRSNPFPGKWWVGGEHRRGRLGRRYVSRKLGGTLLFEIHGRWRAAAGERHEIVEAPVAGTVRNARNGIEVMIAIDGAAIPGTLAAGDGSRGRLDVPPLPEGELRASELDVGRSGAIVVAGSRVGAEALTRARATAIRGVVAGSIAQGDLRDLAASEARQRASLHTLSPFAALALDGHVRRPLPAPLLALLRAIAGRDVAIVTDPPLLVFDAGETPLPEFPPDWVRVRNGPLAGREGRWLGPAGLRRFRAGIHLPAAFVRFDDEPAAVVPINDLERFVL